MQLIPGKGIFFTADTRTTCDFQDGSGDVYCEGAKKLLEINVGPYRGAICHAGTGLRVSTSGNFFAVQTILQKAITSLYFTNLLNTRNDLSARDILDYVFTIIRNKLTNYQFPISAAQVISAEHMIKDECALGVGIINTTNDTMSMYGHGFIFGGRPIVAEVPSLNSPVQPDVSYLIGSTENYLNFNIDPNVLPTMDQLKTYHDSLINNIKQTRPDMVNGISDEYDYLDCDLSTGINFMPSDFTKSNAISQRSEYLTLDELNNLTYMNNLNNIPDGLFN